MGSRRGLASLAEIDSNPYLDAFGAFAALSVDTPEFVRRGSSLAVLAEKAVTRAADQVDEFVPPLPDQLRWRLLEANKIIVGGEMESEGTAGGMITWEADDIRYATRLIGAIAYAGMRPPEGEMVGTI